MSAAVKGLSWRAGREKGAFATMLCDLGRVKAALRAGARPQQIYGIDGCTRRAKQPDTIAQGPDGDVLILVRHGRVTMLVRLWDEERARSRSPRGQKGAPETAADDKGIE